MEEGQEFAWNSMEIDAFGQQVQVSEAETLGYKKDLP